MLSDASEYMNLKITAYDSNDGSYSYYKTLLVDVVPDTLILYKVFDVGVGRDFAFYLGDYMQDLDGDFLNFYLQNSADQTELRNYAIDFYPSKKLIAGHPIKTGVISTITIVAEDVHY